jgi:uncharacterized membrane protein YgcG
MVKKIHPKEHLKHFFAKDEEADITRAVQEAEKTCGVEFRVAIAHASHRDVHKLAARVFKHLGIAKASPDHPGVLVLVLPVRDEFVLWGNKRVHEALAAGHWERARDAAIPLFKEGRNKDAITTILQMLSQTLAQTFPPVPGAVSHGAQADKPIDVR